MNPCFFNGPSGPGGLPRALLATGTSTHALALSLLLTSGPGGLPRALLATGSVAFNCSAICCAHVVTADSLPLHLTIQCAHVVTADSLPLHSTMVQFCAHVVTADSLPLYSAITHQCELKGWEGGKRKPLPATPSRTPVRGG
eukprot:6472709-Amphidinium_carterae.2